MGLGSLIISALAGMILKAASSGGIIEQWIFRTSS